MLLSAAGRPAASAAAAGAPCGPPASGIRPSPANTENSVSLLPLWEREPSGWQEAAWGTMTPAPSPPRSARVGAQATANTHTGHRTPRPSCRWVLEERALRAIPRPWPQGLQSGGSKPRPRHPSLTNGPGDLTLHEPQSPHLVRIQPGGSAVMPPCVLSCSGWDCTHMCCRIDTVWPLPGLWWDNWVPSTLITSCKNWVTPALS